MSFILDALKKSEAERQKQKAPGIASIPESGDSQSTSKWVWVIVILLAANLGAVTYITLKPDTEEPPAPAEQPAPAMTAELAANPVDSPPQPLAEPVSQETPAVQSSPPVSIEPVTGEPTAEASISDPEPLPAVVDGLPSFNELRAQGVLQLSDLHLDIHVYSGTPAERFVFINMSKYTENSTLAEGPTVIEITPDGVVLDHLGAAFLLPRE